MMSLHTFDRTYAAGLAPGQHLSPLLTREALRRLAWSNFYMDTFVDGGRYGFHTIEDSVYRLQLPCDQAAFLGNDHVVTETLFPDASEPLQTAPDAPAGQLDMSAYLLRTAAMRRRALHFAFRASHKEQTFDKLHSELQALETSSNALISALPRRFHFSTENVFLHRNSLVTFVLLHVLRHNLFIVLGRAALLVWQRDDATNQAAMIPAIRRRRILHAKPIAGLLAEGLQAGISFDPQLGVQAYVALESMSPEHAFDS